MEATLTAEYAHPFTCLCSSFQTNKAIFRCDVLRTTINQITENEYSQAKRDVDTLRAELGEPPLKGVQTILEEKNIKFV
jgi:hypothetical protein